MAMQQADKNFLDDVYDTLMKNTQYKVRDFTKYKDVWIDVEPVSYTHLRAHET